MFEVMEKEPIAVNGKDKLIKELEDELEVEKAYSAIRKQQYEEVKAVNIQLREIIKESGIDIIL